MSSSNPRWWKFLLPGKELLQEVYGVYQYAQTSHHEYQYQNPARNHCKESLLLNREFFRWDVFPPKRKHPENAVIVI